MTDRMVFNPLPNDNFFLPVQIESICRRQNTRYLKTEIPFGIGRKHGEKVENVGYQHFLPCPQCFQKVSFSGSLKVGIVL